MKSAKSAIAILITALMLAVAPAALAQDASVSGYGGGGGTQQVAAEGGAGPDAGPSEAGTLPFTGLDVGIALAGGLLLIAVGASVAWLARPRDAS